MDIQTNKMIILLILISGVLISGCAGQKNSTKSSVIDYLYPKSSDIIVKPSVPVLKIPIKVGIAFVPEQAAQSTGKGLWPGFRRGGSLTEANKTNLLQKVADHFKEYEFVSEIEVIPSAYLTPGGSFSNLEQIQTMYGIDVIALVSHDQVQFTDEGALSLTYWTLVGAYIVSGEKNSTSTMIDVVVYDIKSKKMLFRSPGTSNINGTSTLINLTEQLRSDRLKGFEEATQETIKNLDIQLELFRKKVKNSPEKVKIIHSKGYSGGGYSGGGSISMIEISLISLFAAASISRNISKNARSIIQRST